MAAFNEVRLNARFSITRILHYKSPSKQFVASEKKEQQSVPDMSATSALEVQEALIRRGLGMAFAEVTC